MKDMIIIDNNPASFALNVENGIPIKSWYEDRNDRELITLIPILEFLANVGDIRDYVKMIVNGGEVSLRKFHNMILTGTNKINPNPSSNSLQNSNSTKSYLNNKSNKNLNFTPIKGENENRERKNTTPRKKSTKDLNDNIRAVDVKASGSLGHGHGLGLSEKKDKDQANKEKVVKNAFLYKEELKSDKIKKMRVNYNNNINEVPTTVKHINFNDLKLTKDMINLRPEVEKRKFSFNNNPLTKSSESGLNKLNKQESRNAGKDANWNSNNPISSKNKENSSSIEIIKGSPSTTRGASSSSTRVNKPLYGFSQNPPAEGIRSGSQTSKSKNLIPPTSNRQSTPSSLKLFPPSGVLTSLNPNNPGNTNNSKSSFKTVIQLESTRKPHYSSYLTNK